MNLLLTALVLLGGGGLAALALSARPRWASRIGAGSAMTAAGLGLIPAVQGLLFGTTGDWRSEWSLPLGSFHLGLDPLSALFLIPVLVLVGVAALYGVEYLAPEEGHRPVGALWFWFNLLAACMVMVLLARDAVLFLLVWEVMSLASFFLVVYDHERPEAREAGWLYLVATHLGTAFLVVFFFVMGREAGSMDFDRIGQVTSLAPVVQGVAFLLAVVGFGTKAGFVPLHVWLPEAHPAAPSHVSAIMSGVMIKTGIYGLLRALLFLGHPPLWWGWLLIAIGLSSGILGVLFALAQHDLKRLLAYHSVENIGIIALGLGVGLLGLNALRLDLAHLAFAGALLHVVNHAFFKSLLFLGAGAVARTTGTRDIERLGGLLRRMPWTGAAFLVGAAAISGLPPLNGFVSEFLIFFASLQGCVLPTTATIWPFVATIAGLALIGGLAAACFAKAFGIVFLGEPRSAAAAGGREVGWAMRLPMLALATGCVTLGLLAPVAVPALRHVLGELTQTEPRFVFIGLDRVAPILWRVIAVATGFLAVLVGLVALRRALLRGRIAPAVGTWDCGYAAPTPRMQYTASSFAQGFVDFFRPVLRTRRKRALPRGYFPSASFMTSETPDGFREMMFGPIFERLRWALSKLRWIQHGRLQIYILYIALTLLVLLIWKGGR